MKNLKKYRRILSKTILGAIIIIVKKESPALLYAGLRCAIIILLTGALISSCGDTVSVTPYGVFGKSRLQHVLGQDGVSPVDFSPSVTMWTFSDTILGSWKGDVSTAATFSERADISTMISNSLAFTGPLTPETVHTLSFAYYKKNKKVQQFIRHKKSESPEKVRLWALDGIRMGNRVYVYYLHIVITDPSKLLSFRVDKIGLARWDVPRGWKIGDPVHFRRLPYLFGDKYPAFGACVIKKDGYIYTVGQYADKNFSSPVKIARVRCEYIEDGNAYEFLRSNGTWVRDISAADSFLGDVQGECSLSYNNWLNKYVILYCQTWKNRMIMVTFDDFSQLAGAEKKVIFTMPSLPEKAIQSMQVYYSGKEIFSWKNLIYAIYINPLDYQPYLLKLSLTK
ncbi:MAG TPA: DUF4185 domain-containing protein [Spirochaetota bacterium]|nr:DUF4185 domain-containing protein [Spirochaetota bacterium]